MKMVVVRLLAAFTVAFCMAVLSPVMAEIGRHLDEGGESDEA